MAGTGGPAGLQLSRKHGAEARAPPPLRVPLGPAHSAVEQIRVLSRPAGPWRPGAAGRWFRFGLHSHPSARETPSVRGRGLGQGRPSHLSRPQSGLGFTSTDSRLWVCSVPKAGVPRVFQGDLEHLAECVGGEGACEPLHVLPAQVPPPRRPRFPAEAVCSPSRSVTLDARAHTARYFKPREEYLWRRAALSCPSRMAGSLGGQC